MSMVNRAVTAVMAALSASPAVSARVERVRLRTLPASTGTAVVVRPMGSEVLDAELPTGHPIAWNTGIAVECYARAAQGVAPDVAVDALLSATYARLMSDATLGGEVIVLQPQSVSYEFDADEANVVCATIQINARQTTPGTTL